MYKMYKMKSIKMYKSMHFIKLYKDCIKCIHFIKLYKDCIKMKKCIK